MKYLIDGNFKAALKGEFVRVQSEDHFIIDTDELNDTNLTIGQLVEIANSNGIEINATKKSKVVDELVAGLNSIKKIKEVNKMTDSQNAEEIIVTGQELGKSKNEVLVDMVNAGILFNKATKLYNQICIQLGLEVSTTDRKAQINEYLVKNTPEYKEYAELLSTVAALQTNIPGLTSSQAVAGIKKFCKENQIEIPNKPKGEKKAKGGFKTQLINWIVNNPLSTQKDLEQYVAQNKKKEGLASRYSFVLEVANRVEAAHNPSEEETATTE